MFPGGMNPKQMKTMLKRMGIKMEEIDANRVLIECEDRTIVVSNPNVVMTKMPNQEMFQVSGEVSEESPGSSGSSGSGVKISDDDVEMVMEQASVDKEKARAALEESEGDIAAAIIKLKG